MTQQLTDSLPSGPPTTAIGIIAYAVFADYDSNAPDSSDLAYFVTEEQAKKAAELGNTERYAGFNGKWYDVPLTAYCEGWEWCKKYATHRVLVPITSTDPDDTVWESVAGWLQAESDEEHDTDPVTWLGASE